jgi:hypothetical protein
MARRKDLGGLAALAGLAYMASRDKATKGGADGAAMDAMTSGAYGGPEKEKVDAGAIFAEDGATSKLRRNTETGDLYSPDEPITRPVAAKPSVPTARRTPTARGRENARDDVLMRQGRYPGTTAEGMRNYAPRRSIAQQIAGRDDTYNPDVGYRTRAENRDTSDLTYKKGGSVKGWGSARGARKAKIY